jgi:hypothetical protein
MLKVPTLTDKILDAAGDDAAEAALRRHGIDRRLWWARGAELDGFVKVHGLDAVEAAVKAAGDAFLRARATLRERAQ